MEFKDKAEWKNFSTPDEVKTIPKGKVEFINVGGATVARYTFYPGWKWSTLIGPLAKTKSHEKPHFAMQLSGKLMIQMDDGTQFENVAGDVSYLPKGHDGWVIGDEPVIFIDFQGLIDFVNDEEKE